MTKISALITQFIGFINNVLVPLVFAVALIVFLFGVFRFLIAGADSPEKRKTGGQIIMYSVIGFAVMISVWGLVNLVVGTFGFDSNTRPCLPTFSGNSNCGLQNDVQFQNTMDEVRAQAVIEQQQIDAQNSDSSQNRQDPTYGDTGLPPIY